MTDDDREGFEPQDAPDDAGDPAAAFEALRRSVEKLTRDLGGEMTVIRRGVETAFDQLEKLQQPTDYGPDLGRIVQQLAHVGMRLEAVEQSPVLRNGPEHYARALERGGESLVNTAARQLERQATDLERSANSLARRLAGARERYVQDRWLWSAGTAGLVAGVLLTLFLPRALPFSADTRTAALIMGSDRISAGYAMIGAADPLETGKMEWGRRFYDFNGDPISACLKTAKQTGKDQKCTITVPAMAQQ
ncbi:MULTISPECIES: DUF6118 family protein [Chelatococcus]|uniref:DUF6118 family protein n=1 Tax=Chelatococcus TaxID=28209 RepID=UPI001BCF1824|nr:MULTISPECIES: DUF6118 family protein [Chelatococcus]CAH1647942.1 conserved hypothetical protein [Hyphomicrobiales bacterium]MBS7701640.1 hypothetical protein [Chelatococcus sp. YT9]MBS7743779.1 hypothetical protein [Chelatococcus sp. HY11]MBX3540283.1 hypothetical protein [Chelatococcus sp.]CAH1657284.1 conserved hypothetical protein [Chelatococcus asaccharovorans]